MLDESSWLLRRPPMWARWVVSFGVAAALLAALIVFVSHHNGNGLARESPKAAARANRLSEIVVEQDQAPQSVAVASGAGRGAVVRAIRHAMARRIAGGDAGAPLQRVTCRTAGASGVRHAYHCTAMASGVNYPYEAVLSAATRRLTFCKHDAPPVPSQNIPVSPRCRLS